MMNTNVEPGTRNRERTVPVAAVFFDVDFTLIYPGPTFQAEGYERFAAAHGLAVDPALFPHAVRAASSVLDEQQQHVYNEEIFVEYTARILEEMGGSGPGVVECARQVFREWAACRHFFLYDDVAPALRALSARGIKIGLISNSHRSMAAFEQHFELDGLIAAAITSFEHGYMKPHPSIFEAALTLVGVAADKAVMVGDSIAHDIEGARRAGMRGVLLHRSDEPVTAPAYVPVIRDLRELERLVVGS
jgi:HAD superfamily hydrolase (TIGR01662 family)